MRRLFILLLIGNLIAFAIQFAVVRRAIFWEAAEARPAQLNAERLRIIRDPSPPPGASNTPAS